MKKVFQPRTNSWFPLKKTIASRTKMILFALIAVWWKMRMITDKIKNKLKDTEKKRSDKTQGKKVVFLIFKINKIESKLMGLLDRPYKMMLN